MPKRRFGVHWLSLWAKCVGIRWDLVVDLRDSALAYMLLARERRVYRYNHALGHRLRQLASTLDLTEPPSPRLWTAPRHDEAALDLTKLDHVG